MAVSIETNHLKFGLSAVVKHAASPYTIGTNELLIPVDASGGNVVLNLPPANAQLPTAARVYFIKVTTSVGSNTITITPNGTDTIDGAATLVINSGSPSLMPVIVASDGVSNWMVLSLTA